jgi:hypothetical protein
MQEVYFAAMLDRFILFLYVHFTSDVLLCLVPEGMVYPTAPFPPKYVPILCIWRLTWANPWTSYILNAIFWNVMSRGCCKNRGTSIIRITRIGELGTTLVVTSNRHTLRSMRSSETSVLTRATWRKIPQDSILHSHRRESLKSYILYPFYLDSGHWL